MKRCPTCHKTFTDQKLVFCTDDGTPLVSVSPEDPPLPPARDADLPREDWNPVAYQPPGSYIPPGGNNRRKVWPWVVGIIGLIVIVIAGLSIAAAFLIPGLSRNSGSRADHGNANTQPDGNVNAGANQNSTPSSSSSPDIASNSETGSRDNVSAPPPEDQEKVLVQLSDLEQEWTVANLNADKKKLSQILADDYVGPTADGRVQGKAEYIQNIERDTTVQKWEFAELKLTLRGDRATLTGKLHLRIKNEESVYEFKDRFVWREGRWQATGSEVKLA